MIDRRTIVLKLRPEPSVDNVDLALRRALKFLLRTCGLRCTEIKLEPVRTLSRKREGKVMSNVELERLDSRLQETFGLVLSRLWRRQVRIKEGPHMNARGEVTSVSLGSRGQVMASVRLNEKSPRRLILGLPVLELVDPPRRPT